MPTLLTLWLENLCRETRLGLSTFARTDTDRCVYNAGAMVTKATLVCSNKCLRGSKDSLPLDLDQLRMVLRNIGIKSVRFRVQLVTVSRDGRYRRMVGSNFKKKWKGAVSAAEGVFMRRVRRDGSAVWKDEVFVTLPSSSGSSRRLPFEFQLHPAVLSRNDATKVDTVGRYALRMALAVKESDWHQKLATHDTTARVPFFMSDTFRVCGRRSHANRMRAEDESGGPSRARRA